MGASRGRAHPLTVHPLARRFHHDAAEFVLSLHLHDGDDEGVAQRWWTNTLMLDDASYTKTFIKPPGTGHRTNILRHGICRVRMRRATDAWYRTMVWIGVVADVLAGQTNG